MLFTSRYRFTIPAKSVHWDIEWDVKDDSMLLVGCYEHGLGSWDAIKDDLNLSLSKVGQVSDYRWVGWHKRLNLSS